MQNLVTLLQAKNWLKITPPQTQDDPMLNGICAAASQKFLTDTSLLYIAQQNFTERLNGWGTPQITLKNRPLISIASLVISNITVSASPDGVTPGYVFDDTRISLIGGAWPYVPNTPPLPSVPNAGVPSVFIRGFGNVFVNGAAGYPNIDVEDEAFTVPTSAPYQYTLVQSATFAGASTLVLTYQNTGEPLAQVTGTPNAGEYVVASTGVLTLAAADAGQVLIADYQGTGIPYDIQQCVTEMVGWCYKNRDRIGITTERFADALSNTYSQRDMSPLSRATVQKYTRRDAVNF